MLVQSAPATSESAPFVPLAARNFPHTARKRPHPRVLVVDDEPLVQWSVAETLSARGYEVLNAGDARTALRMMSDDPNAADVVLLDFRLPDSCDLKLLAMLRGLAPSAPIILMTAFGTPELVDHALQLGAFEVLNKPFELNELAPLILGALAASRPN
jgi:two-component system response regulator AtoC